MEAQETWTDDAVTLITDKEDFQHPENLLPLLLLEQRVVKMGARLLIITSA